MAYLNYNSNMKVSNDISESEYQRVLISQFFQKVLTINLSFFLLRIIFSLFIMIIYIDFSASKQVEFIDSLLVQTAMIIEFLTFVIFYINSLKKNKDKTNINIIKTWFYSYIILSLFWVLLIDAVKYIMFIIRDDSEEYSLFSEWLPYLYILLSSIVITITIYKTAGHLNLKMIKITALGYLLLPMLIILLQSQNIMFHQQSSYLINKIDISATLYNVQYIIWLFVLNIMVRNKCC